MRYSLSVFFVLFCLVSIARAEETHWRDQASGTSFLVLPGKRNAAEAAQACADRGWDLLNLEYLTPEEQARFLASPELKALSWERKFTGEPGEYEGVDVWGSSEYYTNHSAAGIYQYADETKRRRRIVWFQPNELLQTVCMYQSHSWQRCVLPVTCHAATTASITFATEYGRSKQEAVTRLQNRVANLDRSVWQCGMNLDEVRCEVIRPR